MFDIRINSVAIDVQRTKRGMWSLFRDQNLVLSLDGFEGEAFVAPPLVTIVIF